MPQSLPLCWFTAIPSVAQYRLILPFFGAFAGNPLAFCWQKCRLNIYTAPRQCKAHHLAHDSARGVALDYASRAASPSGVPAGSVVSSAAGGGGKCRLPTDVFCSFLYRHRRVLSPTIASSCKAHRFLARDTLRANLKRARRISRLARVFLPRLDTLAGRCLLHISQRWSGPLA